MRSGTLALLVLAVASAAPALPGCEAISSLRGLAAMSEEIKEHLEDDLKSELTDEKITKVLEVTPKLTEFAETSKVKWKPDPNAPDFQQLGKAMGAMADYIAFFESQDTRLTEYYVDLIKIADARALIGFQRGQAEAVAKLDEERKKLEAERATADGDAAKKLDEELERNALARKKLEEAKKQHDEAREQRREQRRQQPGNDYSLSDEEIARVEKRYDEITKIFEGAKYVQETATGDPS